MDILIIRSLKALIIALSIIFGYFIFILAPVSVYAEADCLSKGYPRSLVTITLDRYCMGLDGVVTVAVDKQ